MSTIDQGPVAALDAAPQLAAQLLEIQLTNREGTRSTITAAAGQSMMQAIRASGRNDLLALCGGSCSCATCQVYIEQHAGATLPALTSDEDDLLEGSSFRTSHPRLSCQKRDDARLGPPVPLHRSRRLKAGENS